MTDFREPTADEVLAALEARRDPQLRDNTRDDSVYVQTREVDVLACEIERLRMEVSRLHAQAHRWRTALTREMAAATQPTPCVGVLVRLGDDLTRTSQPQVAGPLASSGVGQ